jgi:hypothetical protein
LSAGAVEEVVVSGSSLAYRVRGSWFESKTGLNPDHLVKLLSSQKVNFEFKDAAEGPQKLIYLASLGAMTGLTLKMLYNELKPEEWPSHGSIERVTFEDVVGNRAAKAALL